MPSTRTRNNHCGCGHARARRRHAELGQQTDPRHLVAPPGRRCGCRVSPISFSRILCSQIPVRGDDGARAVGAIDDAAPADERSADQFSAVSIGVVSKSRACEAEPSDALRQQTDPLEPAGRRFANFFFESSFSRVLFRDFPSDVGQRSDPQSAPRGSATGERPKHGIERSAV